MFSQSKFKMPRTGLAIALGLMLFGVEAQEARQIQGDGIQSATLVADSELADSESSSWWSPGEGRLFEQRSYYPNAYGVLETYNLAGSTETAGHPFFEAIGENGRACVTCHQPADGMSLSLETIQIRWRETQGSDPLFAAVDGSNCPDLSQGEKSSHSLLLEHGLIRIFRPWPPRDDQNKIINPQFSIQIVRDPSKCNTSARHGLHSKTPMVSVFRRPRPAANLKFITAVGFPFEPKDGLPLPLNPQTGEHMSGNITADRRVWTLEAQARDALHTHLQFKGEPSQALLKQIVAFEQQIFSAQAIAKNGTSLTVDNAKGGPEFLAQAQAGVLNSGTRLPMWDEFETWLQDLEAIEQGRNPKYFATLNTDQQAFRLSVARGVRLFRDRTFLVKDNAGITDMGFGNPVRNDCNFCHNMTKSGMDVAPGQVDLGTTNEPFADPAPHLPLFKLTCKPEFDPHPHLGREVFTSDPGLALTTGRCKDIGKITIQSMRGLAGRAPYFSNGTAKDIEGIVDYYERRYNIKLSDQEKQDLTNLMSAL
jgi:hypothetical protein